MLCHQKFCCQNFCYQNLCRNALSRSTYLESVAVLPAVPHMTDDGGANLGKRARKRPSTFTAHAHNDRLKKPKVDKADQPVASAGSTRQNDKPKGNLKQQHQTSSRRQLHVKTKAVTPAQPTSLLQPVVLRRSERLKRKVKGIENAETDVGGGQPNKRARTAVNAVGMDEEQPGAVLSAAAALNSKCRNVRLKTVGRGAAKDSSTTKHIPRRRLHRASGMPVARNVLHNQ